MQRYSPIAMKLLKDVTRRDDYEINIILQYFRDNQQF